MPRIQEARINALVLGFTAALCVLTSVLFGLVPAWQASKPDLNESLKKTAGRAPLLHIKTAFAACWWWRRWRSALVLLAGAGLLIKSFWTLQSLSPGFDATNVLTAGVSLSFNDYPNGAPRRKVFFQQALERIAESAGG